MTVEVALISRSGAKCELCASHDDLVVCEIPPEPDGRVEQSVILTKFVKKAA